MDTVRVVALAMASLLAAARPVAAQSASGDPPAGPPPAAIEGALGWAGFGDESIVHHTLLGISARVYVTRRISIGPELQYMSGPGSDRDTVITGNVVVDVLAATASRPRRTTPYLVVGGGLFRHTSRFLTGSFTSTEGGATAGVGMRTWLSPRVFVAGDARLGWEPHLRLAATLGIAVGGR